MRTSVIALVGTFVVGCSSSGPTRNGTPIQVSQAVAGVMLADTTSVSVAFTSVDNQAELSNILGGAQPTGFRWVMVRVDPPTVTNVSSASGIQVDMTDSSSKVFFSQSYTDVCNPVKDNYSSCWYTESYSAGDAGVSGSLALRMTPTDAIMSADLTWEGFMDRFGNGSNYYYKHGTTTGFDAPIIEGGAP